MATRTRERRADEAAVELRQPTGSAASGRRSRPSLPPGPKTPRLLNMLRYARNPYEALARNSLFGDCGTTRMPGQPPIVGFSDPQAIKEIFAEDPDVLRSGEAMSTYLGPIVGWNSLLVLDGERWRRERRLMQPPFHGERMHNYATTISAITNDVVDEWPIGRPFPIHARMQKITLEVIMRVVFGVEEADQLKRLRSALDRFLSLLNSPTAPFLFFPLFHVDLGRFSPWGRFVRYRRDVEAVLSEEMRRRRAEGTDGRTDVLSMLIATRDEDGQSMSERELLDEMFTLLGAGHETTATSLAWAFYHVLPRKKVLENLREELTRVAGAGPVAPQHLSELKYVDAVIDETMRLTPVATAIMRRVQAPVRIGGHDLPAGINVAASIYATHHRRDFWPNPERFDPDRFMNARPKPYTFFPFGGGVRRCLGAAFAGYEMKIILAEVLSRVEMRVAPGYRAKPVLRTVAVGPSSGVPVIVDSVSPRR